MAGGRSLELSSGFPTVSEGYPDRPATISAAGRSTEVRSREKCIRAVPFLAIGIGMATATTAIVTTWRVAPYPLWIWLPVELAGVSFTLCGALLWSRRPENGTGRLMTATALVWYLGALQLGSSPVLFAVGFCLYHLGSVLMAHVVLAYPGGRLRGWASRLVVGSIYGGLVTQATRYVVEYPPQPQGWGDPAAHYSVWALVGSVHQFLATIVIAVLVLRRWAHTPRRDRREHTLVWTIAVSLCGVTIATDIAAVAHAALPVQRWLLLAYALHLVTMPFALAVGALRGQLFRTRVNDLLVRLDGSLDRDGLEAGLRHALDDP